MVLDLLPKVKSFLGFDLRTGALVVAALCLAHPTVYGYSVFMPWSYLMCTIWLFVGFFFAFTLGLCYGLYYDDSFFIELWLYYSLIFVIVMLLLMFLLALYFTTNGHFAKLFIIFTGLLWYLGTIYFILVINSYRYEMNPSKNGTSVEQRLIQNEDYVNISDTTSTSSYSRRSDEGNTTEFDYDTTTVDRQNLLC